MADKRGVSAAEFRRRRTYTLEVDGMPFVMRSIDLPTLFLEGIIPMPLFAAVDRLETIRQRMETEGPGVMAEMTEEDRNAMDELLRRCAAACCLEPKVVWENANDDQLNVSELTSTQLITIWKAVLRQTGVKIMPDAEAETFRQNEPPPAAAAGGNGDGVRTEAVVMDSPSDGEGESDVEFFASK